MLAGSFLNATPPSGLTLFSAYASADPERVGCYRLGKDCVQGMSNYHCRCRNREINLIVRVIFQELYMCYEVFCNGSGMEMLKLLKLLLACPNEMQGGESYDVI